MFKTTKNHIKFWKNRKADWFESYGKTIDHPHRQLILEKLKKIKFGHIMEIGCNCAPNMLLVTKTFPGVEVGGVDINADSIKVAKELMPKYAFNFEVRSADNIYFSDKCMDVVLTDMALIYVGPDKIHKVMKEITRIARNNIVLCEFHTKNPLKALGLWATSGYFARDYERLLRKYNYYDIELTKLTEEDWPGGNPQKDFGYIITARL